MPNSFSVPIMSRIWDRSISACPPEAVVTGAIGQRLVGQAKRVGDGKDGGRLRVTLASQNVDDDGSREHALIERLLAGRLDGGEPVQAYTFEDRHHLPVAVMHGLQPAAHFLHGGGQNPVVERSTIAQGSRLTGQDRHVMPGIIDRLATAEAAIVLANLHAILPDDDAIGIGMYLGRTTD